MTHTFRINQVCFDARAKEVVKLSNGIETDGVFIPTEAIALRVIGVTKTGDPVVAYTYRMVEPEHLSPAVDSAFIDLNHVRPSRNAGRV